MPRGRRTLDKPRVVRRVWISSSRASVGLDAWVVVSYGIDAGCLCCVV